MEKLMGSDKHMPHNSHYYLPLTKAKVQYAQETMGFKSF